MIKVELTEKEQKVLELIRNIEDGKVEINVEKGEPVRVDVIQENIPLSDWLQSINSSADGSLT